MDASFQVNEEGLSHQLPMADFPSPDTLKRTVWSPHASPIWVNGPYG